MFYVLCYICAIIYTNHDYVKEIKIDICEIYWNVLFFFSREMANGIVISSKILFHAQSIFFLYSVILLLNSIHVLFDRYIKTFENEYIIYNKIINFIIKRIFRILN